MTQRFAAKLAARGLKAAWIFLPIPFDVAKTFGTKGRVAVTGTLNGAAFRKSLMPEGDGTHVMPVNKALQTEAKARAGDEVAVVMAIDRAESSVDVPVELQQALAGDRAALCGYEGLSHSCRREYADWIGSAKKAETRISRAQKALEMLRARKRLR